MAERKNIIKENIEIGGKTSTFDVHLQEGLNLPDKRKFKSPMHMSIEEKSAVVYTQATKAMDDLFKNPENLAHYKSAKKSVKDLVSTVLDDNFTVRSLMKLATHDYYTHTHSLNVSIYSVSLGFYLGLNKSELKELGEAALLHDLGKSKIDSHIINKNGKLTIDEFEEMKHHSAYGYDLSVHIGTDNKKILDGIKYHHEKMDGTGYPDGLKGEEIPMYARIIGVCDIFDALSSRRSYKDGMPTFEVLKFMKTEMKEHVDMKLLNKMILMFK